MSAKQIVSGLYSIALGPVNSFFLDLPEGGVLVDTGLPDSADKILRALEGLGKQPRDVRHIILTHAHPDHIGSAAALRKATGAATYLHSRDVSIAKNGGPFRPLTPAPGLLTKVMFKLFVGELAGVEPVTVDYVIANDHDLPIPGGLRAIHTPGHCAGQVALLWPEHGGVLFAADACLNLLGLGWSLGYEDLEEGGRSLQKLSRLEFQVACFGHGKPIRQDASARFRKRWPDPVE